MKIEAGSFLVRRGRVELGPVQLETSATSLNLKSSSYGEALANLAHLLYSGKLPYYNRSKKEYLVRSDDVFSHVSFDGRRFIEDLYRVQSAAMVLAHDYFKVDIEGRGKDAHFGKRLLQLDTFFSIAQLASPTQDETSLIEQAQAHVSSLSTEGVIDGLKARLILESYFYDQESVRGLIPDATAPIRSDQLKQHVKILFRAGALAEARKLARSLWRDQDMGSLPEVLVNLAGFMQAEWLDGLTRADGAQVDAELARLIPL